MTDRWGDLPDGWYQPPPAVGRAPSEEPRGAPVRPAGVPDQPDWPRKRRSLVAGPDRMHSFGFVWAWVVIGREPKQARVWEKCVVPWVLEDPSGWWVQVNWSGRTAFVHETATAESTPAPGEFY